MRHLRNRLLIALFFSLSAVHAQHDQYVEQFAACVGADCADLYMFDHVSTVRNSRAALMPAYTRNSLPLCDAFPLLKKHLPCFMLGQFPTRVVRLEHLESCLPLGQCYMKLDSESGIELIANRRFFGGNKVRKLEFILADAWLSGARSILTFGCAGSNFATAAAVYARRLGLQSYLILADQPNSYIVRRNLAIMSSMYSHLYHCESSVERKAKALQVCKQMLEDGEDMPYTIPVGGSNALGAIGYVNAAFELKEQVEKGELEEPDMIYVPAGSYGTAAGLLLGIKAAGLSSQLIAVAIEPVQSARKCMDDIIALAQQTNALLHEKDASFPLYAFDEADIRIETRCCGSAYALYTPQAVELCNLTRIYENIELDGVYSAKAFDALVRDAQAGLLKDKKVLFWHTFCSAPVEESRNVFDYQVLPIGFHRYFEYDVQPLDRKVYE